VQVDPIKPMLKPPGTKRLKLKYDELLSNVAFKFNLRRYNEEREHVVEEEEAEDHAVGRCRLTVSKPELIARPVSALETKM